ncbi:protein IN2-1 homolog B-like [Amaranthus tricolor]|uniref:protein IN2-1 homolog B-like n=1 Tax=Amaranthus tricolor TaxID=29722 RepID=UPI002590B112|nr:protein IN2-1 homolog B-like [Amaranthus tricolor]
MAKIDILPPTLDSTSEKPPNHGKPRLYTCYTCPFAQRVWIGINYKGLQEKIELIPIDLNDKPTWYKDVYPPAKVPTLEHNNQIIAESLDLLKYLDTHFDGPKLLPDDPAKNEFSEEMMVYAVTFGGATISYLKGGPEADMVAALDKIEEALSKFDGGPFFLGEFSAVDIAYAPFVERLQPLLLEVKNYDITSGRPKLATWIQEVNKIDGYRQTKWNIDVLTSIFKKQVLGL